MSRQARQLLNRIGADLHDGPVQLLSLLILKLSGGASGLPKAALEHLPDIRGAELAPAHLARLVLNELRELATGLVMPEIEHMPLEAALRNAVEQHEYATGSKVTEPGR